MSLFDSGIRPVIDDYLLKLSKEKRDYGEYFSASSGGYCMRKVIFERLGVPHVENEGDARKQRVFTSGHIFHEWIQKLTRETGLSIAQELELQDENLMVRGHIDDLVLVDRGSYDGNDGENHDMSQHLILYDYKTAHSKSFSYKKKDDKMSHFHRMQLGTYMYMLRKLKSAESVLPPDFKVQQKLGKYPGVWGETETWIMLQNLTEARILLISKDDMRLHEQQLVWSPQLEKDVVGYWRTLNGYWRERKIPRCTCDKFEGGFMAQEKWNPFYYEGEACSLNWYKRCKEEGLLHGSD